MFGFDAPEDGSQERFHDRIKVFETKKKPKINHHMWWIIHNVISHPLIGLLPVKQTFDFHDYTSRKINAE